MLFVTHNIEEAIIQGDRIIAMSSQPGRILTVIDNPISRPRTPDSPGFADIWDDLHRLLGVQKGAVGGSLRQQQRIVSYEEMVTRRLVATYRIGGGGGIRTHEGREDPGDFQDRSLHPLGHSSALGRVAQLRIQLMTPYEPSIVIIASTCSAGKQPRQLLLGKHYYASIRSRPPMYGLSASGMTTDPSASW